jgi:hypothetical protein
VGFFPRTNDMAKSASKERVLTDHEEILQWAEERGAKPGRVRGTGGNGDVGIIRLMFPNYSESEEDSLEEISWDDWFNEFDKRNLALIVQEETASGTKSNFNKIVSRETVEELQSRSSKTETGKQRESERRSGSGTGRTSSRSTTSRQSTGKSGGRGATKTTSRASASGRSAQSKSSSTGRSAKKTGRQANASTTSRSSSGKKGPSRSTSKGRSSKSA